MDQKTYTLPIDFKEAGPFGKLGKAMNAIGRMLNGMTFLANGSVINDGNKIVLITRSVTTGAPTAQFASAAGSAVAGVAYVTVYAGYHMTPYGAFRWPAADDMGTVAITGAGWVITRQAKSGPGDVTVVFQATAANPSSTTHYESNVTYVTYDSGKIGLKYGNPGERNFVATI